MQYVNSPAMMICRLQTLINMAVRIVWLVSFHPHKWLCQITSTDYLFCNVWDSISQLWFVRKIKISPHCTALIWFFHRWSSFKEMECAPLQSCRGVYFRHCTKFAEHEFAVARPSIWISLFQDTCDALTLTELHKRLQIHLFDLAYYICKVPLESFFF